MNAVKQIQVKRGVKVNELVNAMGQAGIMGAGNLARAVSILETMIRDKGCKTFFGVAGAMVPGGMKNIIIEMLEKGWIDVFVTTGANLTHDLAEALGHKHYQGDAKADDARLYKKGLVRMYNAYMPSNVYEDMEDFIEEHFDELSQENNAKDFLWKLGSKIKSPSILRTCCKKKIPIFCPALNDSGIGLMIWGRLAKGRDCKLKVFEDLKEIIDIAWTSKKNGVFYIGGGAPKNYIQQAMQFSPTKASYGVQITMDRPEHGGSSGAELREGISWGKMEAKARFVDVICDATIALPIIHASLKDRL